MRRSHGGAVEATAAVLRRSPARRAVQWRRHRGLRRRDAFLASYPRSGNTVLRFVLADLVYGEPPDFVTIDRMCPVVGWHRDAPGMLSDGGRLIKTHEPYRAAYERAIYLVRDPRDVVLSWYSLLSAEPERLEGFDAFVTDFVRGRVAGYGSWQNHVRGWLDAAGRTDGIRIDRFEAMRSDLQTSVAEACAFLGIEVDASRIDEAIARNSVERMRELERQNIGYLRSLGWQSVGVRGGNVGGWREVLTDRHLRELEPALVVAAELGYDV